MGENQMSRPNSALTEQPGIYCSFCRKGRRESGPLVEGPGPTGTGGVFICGDCAKLALSIIEQEQQRFADRIERQARGELGRPRG